eukprot:jgi/Mesvir1/26987/Mv20698-RA.1
MYAIRVLAAPRLARRAAGRVGEKIGGSVLSYVHDPLPIVDVARQDDATASSLASPSCNLTGTYLRNVHFDAGQIVDQKREFFSLVPNLLPGVKQEAALSRKHQERRLIGYTPDQLFNVVANVDAYKHFVPWCKGSRVLRRVGDNYLEAELEVGFKIFLERYISKVTLQRPTLVKSVVSHSMLFHHLESTWSFTPDPATGGCWLHFNIEFSFKSLIYRQASAHCGSVVLWQVLTVAMGSPWQCAHCRKCSVLQVKRLAVIRTTTVGLGLGNHPQTLFRVLQSTDLRKTIADRTSDAQAG